jgi:hypothetical protein
MSKKKLDLLQFAAGGMARTGARPSQVMRGERFDVCSLCAGFSKVPNHVLCDVGAQTVPFLRIDLNSLPLTIGNALCPSVERVLDPRRNGNRPHAAGFAHKVDNRPMILSTLDRLPHKAHDLRAPQTAAEQERNYCRIAISTEGDAIKARQELLALRGGTPISDSPTELRDTLHPPDASNQLGIQ